MPEKKSQAEFVIDFFCGIMTPCPDDIEEEEYYPFYNTNRPDKAKKLYAGSRALSKRDMKFIKSHFDEEAFEELVERLDDSAQQQLIDELNKKGIDADFSDLSSVMCDMFLECLESGNIKKVNIQKNKKSISNKKTLTDLSDFKETIINEARRFCRKYYDCKNLLPLCQVAMYVSPMQPCVRDIYNEYIELDPAVKKAIMVLNDIKMFEFEEMWEYKYLAMFEEDIKKLGISNINLFYDAGKYYHRIKNLPWYALNDMNPRCFPKVPSKYCSGEHLKYNDLMGYIDEYLYYKDDAEVHKYVSIAPLDYINKERSLTTCSDNEIAFWLNLFVYSACFVIPKYCGRIDLAKIVFNAPNLAEIETYEDLYYSSLLCLFDIYHTK